MKALSHICEILSLFIGAWVGGTGDFSAASWAVSLAVYFRVSRELNKQAVVTNNIIRRKVA